MTGADRPLAGIRVLLVEDDEDSRDLLSLVLADAGATVTTASNATEGYELFKSAPPAVVVTDVAMPERDGLWLLDAVRCVVAVPRVPVIALTALAMPNEREEIRAAGFDAHIVKPAEPERIVGVVARLVGRG